MEDVGDELVKFYGHVGYCVWQRPFPGFGFDDGSCYFSGCGLRRTQGAFERYVPSELFLEVVDRVGGLYGSGPPPFGFYIQGNVCVISRMIGQLLDFMVVVSSIGLELGP